MLWWACCCILWVATMVILLVGNSFMDVCKQNCHWLPRTMTTTTTAVTAAATMTTTLATMTITIWHGQFWWPWHHQGLGHSITQVGFGGCSFDMVGWPRHCRGWFWWPQHRPEVNLDGCSIAWGWIWGSGMVSFGGVAEVGFGPDALLLPFFLFLFLHVDAPFFWCW